jgi:putative transport protein
MIASLAAHSVTETVAILCLVIATGLAIGSLAVKQLRFGVAGVLFSGLLFGHFGFRIDQHLLEFLREFGLILFVFTIGLQVGPSFLSSLKKQGLLLNALGAGVVVLGGLFAILWAFFPGISVPAVAGLFSGATTNTPSLAAAQAALENLPTKLPGSPDLPGMAYAVTYPFGILGIILTMFLVRRIFRVDVATEVAAVAEDQRRNPHAPDYLDLEVTNANLDGLPIKQVPFYANSGLIASRLFRDSKLTVPTEETTLRLGDSLRLVGPRATLRELANVIGKPSAIDLRSVPSDVTTDRIYVTRRDVLGRTIGELQFAERFGVAVTRITRAEVEFAAGDNLRLHLGDLLFVVGPNDGIRQVSEAVGNKPKALTHPQVLPVFVGILLGVLLGSLPIAFPGVPAPLKLGLAGGPLLVAILLSQFGRIGPLVWYLTPAANLVLREIGIVLFLACVGLKSGERFFDVLLQGQGFIWMLLGAIITFIPLMIAGIVGRMVGRLDYATLCGVLAGSMTDPPALAFAATLTQSDQPLISYATVYPLVMILRIVIAQAIVLLLGL